jgi:predicted nucleotidyltransferase
MAAQIYTINDIRERVAPVARDYGIRTLSLFGSYARGEATSESDVDLRIVDRGDLRGLFRLAAFQSDLEKCFRLSVDVLPSDSLDSAFLGRIEDEEVIVYES